MTLSLVPSSPSAPLIKQGMILAAGLGTRLRPLTLTTPKPLLPLQGQKKVIDFLIERLQAHGVERLVVNASHLSHQVEEFCHSATGFQEKILSLESQPLNTGGGVLKVLSHFNDEPFFVLNGDMWWEETHPSLLSRLNQAWDTQTMDALLAVGKLSCEVGQERSPSVPKRTGDYAYIPPSFAPASSKGLVSQEVQNTPQHTPGHLLFRSRCVPSQLFSPDYVFMGVRILHPRLFDSVRDSSLNRGDVDFSQVDLFHDAEAKKRLRGLIHPKQWCDMGTIQAYDALRSLLSS